LRSIVEGRAEQSRNRALARVFRLQRVPFNAALSCGNKPRLAMEPPFKDWVLPAAIERRKQLERSDDYPSSHLRTGTEEAKMKFKPGESGNPGGRPKVVAEVQDLARQHAPAAIVELARLALKAKNETVRVAAIRELLDRGYGRPRQGLEITPPPTIDPMKMLLAEIAASTNYGDACDPHH
jgi:hypothetical protein